MVRTMGVNDFTGLPRRDGFHRTSFHYRLRCLGCDTLHEESQGHPLLVCPACSGAALLRAEYDHPDLALAPNESGLYRYRNWLPIRRSRDKAPGTIPFRSPELADELGLNDLVVLFNGYWPDRGAEMITGSFKELEAFSATSRLDPQGSDAIVVASAGNTGRAFYQICSRFDIPAVIVVPESSLSNIWTTERSSSIVTLVVVGGGADYLDAIEFANRITALPGYFAEGGARNVARRDGMGTTLLTAYEFAGKIPDHYIQAVGSGTGAIAAWEMALRLSVERDRSPMRLHLAQNAPFTIMADAWLARSPEIPPFDAQQAKRDISSICASVLSNRRPPYGIPGGLYDALVSSNGCMYRVANSEARTAGELFSQIEGVDLDPAAEVALACLQQAVANGEIRHDDAVALNLTGGGYSLARSRLDIVQAEPDLFVQSPALASVEERLAAVRHGAGEIFPTKEGSVA